MRENTDQEKLCIWTLFTQCWELYRQIQQNLYRYVSYFNLQCSCLSDIVSKRLFRECPYHSENYFLKVDKVHIEYFNYLTHPQAHEQIALELEPHCSLITIIPYSLETNLETKVAQQIPELTQMVIS